MWTRSGLSDGCAVFAKDQGADQANEEEADDFDKHVGGGVSFGEAVPIPVRHIGRDRSQNSRDCDKADATGKSVQTGLSQKEDDQNGFDNFGGGFQFLTKIRD